MTADADLAHRQTSPGSRTKRLRIIAVVDGPGIHRLARALGVGVAVLALLNVVAIVLRHGLGHEWVLGFRDLIDLNREGSFGTWFAGLLLAALAAVSVLCGVQDQRLGGRWRRNWFLLAGAFVYVSMDEILAIHERVALVVRPALGTSGALYFAWTIPALLLVALFGLVQLRFLAQLARATRLRLFAAAGVFLTGAVGLEMIESAVFTAAGRQQTLLFDSLSAVEEVMELSAVALALCALLHHLLRDETDLTLGSADADRTEDRARSSL